MGKGKAYCRRDAKEGKRTGLVFNFQRYVWAGGTAQIFHWLTQGPFAIVSAKRPEKTPEQNARDFTSLKRQALVDGYGFYPAEGFYKGATEDSLFIPNISLDDAIRYGRLFVPVQETVLWGQGGTYNFYRMSDGMPARTAPGNVAQDFSVLNDDEIGKLKNKLLSESSDEDLPGFTDIKRKKALPFTLEKDKMQGLRDKGKLAGARPWSLASYVIASDPRPGITQPMGNFNRTVSRVSINADSFDCDEYHLSFGMLLFALPL